MNDYQWNETMVEKRVTYMLEIAGEIIVIENVPARVCVETGERFFAPKTVERIQTMIWERQVPVRMMQMPVYAFA